MSVQCRSVCSVWYNLHFIIIIFLIAVGTDGVVIVNAGHNRPVSNSNKLCEEAQ